MVILSVCSQSTSACLTAAWRHHVHFLVTTLSRSQFWRVERREVFPSWRPSSTNSTRCIKNTWRQSRPTPWWVMSSRSSTELDTFTPVVFVLCDVCVCRRWSPVRVEAAQPRSVQSELRRSSTNQTCTHTSCRLSQRARYMNTHTHTHRCLFHICTDRSLVGCSVLCRASPINSSLRC